MIADRQTDTHTHKHITILRFPIGGGVITAVCGRTVVVLLDHNGLHVDDEDVALVLQPRVGPLDHLLEALVAVLGRLRHHVLHACTQPS